MGAPSREVGLLRRAAGEAIPIMLALQTILGLLQLIDAVNLLFFPTIHRSTRTMRFDLGVSLVAPLLLLDAIWAGWMARRRSFTALLLPVAAGSALVNLGLEMDLSVVSLTCALVGLWAHRNLAGYLAWLLAVLGAVEAAALAHWAVLVPLGLSSPLGPVAMFELDLFYVVAYLAPPLVLYLMFLWAIKPLLGSLLGRSYLTEPEEKENVGVGAADALLLAFSIVLSAVAALYPYMEKVNPGGANVGVDIRHYEGGAVLVEQDLGQAFRVLDGSRPLVFFVIYGFRRLFGLDVAASIRLLPLLLNPLLVLSVFFLSWEVSRNRRTASWAAFFTAVGYQITVGMYAYFLTNLLALAVIFSSLGLLFRSIRRNSSLSLAAASALGGLLPFIHPWTFDQFAGAAGVTAILILNEARKGRLRLRTFAMMTTYLAALGASELLKTLVFKGVGAARASLEVVRRSADLERFWFTSIFTFRLLFGGFMSSLLLLGFAAVGLYILRRRDVPRAFIHVLLAASSLVYLIGDDDIKSRLVYNIPIGLLSASGFVALHRLKFGEGFKRSLTLFTILSQTVYLLRSLANLI